MGISPKKIQIIISKYRAPLYVLKKNATPIPATPVMRKAANFATRWLKESHPTSRRKQDQTRSEHTPADRMRFHLEAQATRVHEIQTKRPASHAELIHPCSRT